MVSKEKMQEIYEIIKTPYKHGAVIKFDDSLTDSPTVFKYNGKWYMYFVRINKDVDSSGYETHMASSDNLIDWNYEGVILKRTNDDSWDSKQRGGYAAFVDVNFGGSNEIQKVNDKYYMSYIGGCLDGYETDPISMGLAYSENPIDANSFSVFPEPVLTGKDEDARELEKMTIYKADLFIDEAMTLGHRYVNAYNAKAMDWKERIFLAVSDDAEHWQRYGDDAIINEVGIVENLAISGDPQIVKINDVYVMFYFRAISKGGGAYNNFACSYDLVNWTVWDGEPLIKIEEDWENVYAHKNWVIKDKGVVYHFYCAVNDKGERFIALATSKKAEEK